jgi:hypothetical protein
MSAFAVTDARIETAYKESSKARNNLTIARHNTEVLNDVDNVDDEYTYFPKVCCICDRLIKYKHERFINIKRFSTNAIIKRAFHRDMVQHVQKIPPMAKRKLHDHYTQRFFLPESARDKDVNLLNKMILSPRSYGKVFGANRRMLGCCSECESGLRSMVRPDTITTSPPRFAIVNGLMIGEAPDCIQELNEVELALLSPARTEKHIFSYSAGVHKSIRGWHTMYANNVAQMSRVLNYFEEDDDSDDESDVGSLGEYDVNRDESEEMGAQHQATGFDVPQMGRDENKICVILSGPFTTTQYALTKERTAVRRDKVKEARKWLEKNNILYKDVVFDNEVIEPHYIECHRIEDASNTNVETVFEISAVFPTESEILDINGGYRTTHEFKKNTLEDMLSGDGERNDVLIARSSSTILRDYVDDNLLKAFPLQFPYGIGHLDCEGKSRMGTPYLQHLLNLSNPNFHVPDFVLVVFNMSEIKRMVSSSFLRVSNEQKASIGQLKNDDMQDAIERFLCSRSQANNPADMFLKKLHAVTGSMSHTAQAAKRARQDMFSMIARFGLPSILFTITPDDSMSFRIKIMSTRKDGCKEPPLLGSDDATLKEFVFDCANTRTAYPSLSALDFENIIDITIHRLLGWDVKKKQNIKGEGLFGELDAYCYCVEEQVSKELLLLHNAVVVVVIQYDNILLF